MESSGTQWRINPPEGQGNFGLSKPFPLVIDWGLLELAEGFILYF